jgi:uncharacterized protein
MSKLASFLADPARPEGTLTYHELQGFLFAITSAPEMVMPSEWTPIVFNNQEAGYKDLDEVRAITAEIMVLYNAINEGVFEGRAALPHDCVFRRPAIANFDDDAPVAQWSRGFAQGHGWLENDWEPFMVDEFEDAIHGLQAVLSFFASRRFADAYMQETQSKDHGRTAGLMVRMIPEALERYASLGRSFGKIAMRLRARDAEQPAPEPARSAKVGRNDPCPCGSGKKYKKCHGASVGQ